MSSGRIREKSQFRVHANEKASFPLEKIYYHYFKNLKKKSDFQKRQEGKLPDGTGKKFLIVLCLGHPPQSGGLQLCGGLVCLLEMKTLLDRPRFIYSCDFRKLLSH